MTIIEKLKELDAATAWQPIETAPKDCKIIISYYYRLPSHTKYFWDYVVSKWDENIDNWSGLSHGEYAAHWKPISDDNHSPTIKAAIAALEKQARDIDVLRGALGSVVTELSHSKNLFSEDTPEYCAYKSAKQALEQTGE